MEIRHEFEQFTTNIHQPNFPIVCVSKDRTVVIVVCGGGGRVGGTGSLLVGDFVVLGIFAVDYVYLCSRRHFYCHILYSDPRHCEKAEGHYKR